MRSRDGKRYLGLVLPESIKRQCQRIHAAKHGPPEYRCFLMRLSLEGAKSQRLLAIEHVHAGINLAKHATSFRTCRWSGRRRAWNRP